LRELLRVFQHYRPEEGLDALFARVDWSGASPRQLAHAFLGRPPADGAISCADPRAEARRLFESDAFRGDLLRRMLMAFPARQRLLFVHLPKCAGSDFEAAMEQGHASLHDSIKWLGRYDAEELALRLHAFMRQLQKKSDTIFVGGHVPLRWYIDTELYRYNDRLLTIVRHPHEIAISFTNYALLVMRRDPQFATEDARSWGRLAGLESFDPTWPAATIKDLAHRIIATDGLLPVNSMCELLGDRTADSVFRNFARVDIEITHVALYTAWLRARWGIERTYRANAAPRIITAADLSSAEKARIAAACTEDMKLYTAVTAKLESTGELSVMGPQM
jgi:hypothetical protein